MLLSCDHLLPLGPCLPVSEAAAVYSVLAERIPLLWPVLVVLVSVVLAVSSVPEALMVVGPLGALDQASPLLGLLVAAVLEVHAFCR